MNMRNTCLHACLELFEVINKDMMKLCGIFVEVLQGRCIQSIVKIAQT